MAVKFKDTININGQYTLPLTDGADGQVLVTDGAGNLTFSSESIAGSADSAESTHLNVKNTSGASIAKGTPVYVTGSVGNTDKLEIAPADASNASHMPAIGLLESTLANNGEGFVVQGGLLKGLVTATIDGSSSTANDTVYVKAGGGLTLTKPTGSTNFIQNIAKVARVHSSNGSLIVSSILRTNDVPNLTTGKIWVGDGNTIESTVVHIDETNGRLGIGTTLPSQDLEILNGTTGAGIRLAATGTAYWDIERDASTGHLTFTDDGAGTVLTVGQNGNVGINVTDPDAQLEIVNSSGGSYRLGYGGGTDSYFDSENFYIRSGNGGSNKLIVNSSGKVGIGTTSPSHKLEVSAKGSQLGSSGYYINSSFNDTDNNVGVFTAHNDTSNGVGAIAGINELAFITYGTSWGERMRIDSSGNVGIGVVTPGSKLHIGGAPDSKVITIDQGGRQSAIGTYFSSNTSDSRIDFFISDGNTNGGSNNRMSIKGNGNVGIGTTSPGAKLDVKGDGADFFLQSADFKIARIQPRGTGANLDKGLFSLFDGSVEKVRIDTQGNSWLNGGQLGIGTTSPSSTLHLESASSPVLTIKDTTNGVTLLAYSQDNDSHIGTYSNHSLVFDTDSTERMRIDSSGRVGIGIQPYATNALLNLRGTGLALKNDLAGSNNNWSIIRNEGVLSRSNIAFYSGQGLAMTINHEKNVGIGNTNPSQKLTVSGNAYIAGGLLLLDDNQPIQWGNSQQKIKGNNNGYLQFITGNSEKMRIDSSGNVGIGTSPYASTLGTFTSIDLGQSASMWGYLNSVYLNSNAYFNNGWLYKNTGSAGVLQVDGNVLTFRHAISGTANTAIGLSEAFRISSSGNVTATVDMRAPIFYDSQNTNYYVDPTSTSKFETINIVDSSSTHGVLHTDDPYHGLTMRGYPNTANSIAMTAGDYMSFWEYGGVFRFYKKRPSVLTLQAWIDNGSITATTDSRAPIFYDSDNTGYYVNPAGNSSIKGVDRGLTQVSGWVPAYSAVDPSFTLWSQDEDAVELASSGDSSIGMSFRARRIASGQTVRFTVTLKGSEVKSNGLYIRLSVYNGSLPDGKTHVSNNASNSSPFVVEDSSQVTNWYENGAIGTSWQTESYEYTATSDCYVSLTILNWTGLSTSSVFVKNPDIQTVQIRQGTYFDDDNTNFYANFNAVGDSIRAAGDIVAYYSSDKNLKDNIIKIDGALDKVNAIGGYTFEWNEESHKQTGSEDVGVIAQEVEEIFPEIVQTRSNGYKAVQYEKLVPLLIEAVKELSEKVKILENK